MEKLIKIKRNIKKYKRFSLECREVHLSKKKQLVFEEAQDNRHHTLKEPSNAQEDLLLRSGEFGAESPEALPRIVWWLLALHIRSVPETRAGN